MRQSSNKWVNLIYQFLTKNKVFIIFFTIITIASIFYAFFQKSDVIKPSISNSPNSINTINQSGGTNIINQVPKPKLTITFGQINLPTNDGKYRSEFTANVDSSIKLTKIVLNL